MTSHQLPERRPKLIDLNLLPPEYQPRKVSKLNIALVISAIVLVCLLAPFIFLKADVDAENAPLQTTLNQLIARYNELLPLQTQARNLQREIDRYESRLASINQDYETFVEGRKTWSEIITEIDDAIPGKKVTLKSITQKTGGITLVGTATKDDYFWDYVVALEECEHISGVETESLKVTGGGVSFTITVTLSGGGQ